MAWGATDLLGVEWISDKTPVLEQIGPLLGSILVAIVAAFAAWLAATTANRRQDRQLEHDTERQEAALANDRALREREATRVVVDRAMEGAVEAMDTALTLEVQVFNEQKALNEGDGDAVRQHHEVGVRVLKDEVSPASIALNWHHIRLDSRPQTDDLADAYGHFRDTHTQLVKLLRNGLSNNLSQEEEEAIHDMDRRATEKGAELLEAAGDWWSTGAEASTGPSR
jgi:hypothetical protein